MIFEEENEEKEENEEYEEDIHNDNKQINNIIQTVFNNLTKNKKNFSHPVIRMQGCLTLKDNEDILYDFYEFSHVNFATEFSKLFTKTPCIEYLDEDNILCCKKNDVLYIENVSYLIDEFYLFQDSEKEFYGYSGLSHRMEKIYIVSDYSIYHNIVIFKDRVDILNHNYKEIVEDTHNH